MKGSRFLLLILFLAGFLKSSRVWAQPAARGQVPVSRIKNSDYTPGIIYVKLKAGYAETVSRHAKSQGNGLGIAKFDELTKRFRAAKLSRSFERVLGQNATEKQSLPGIDRWVTIELAAGQNTLEALQAFRGLADVVEAAEPSYKRVLFDSDTPLTLWTPNDSAFLYQWNFNNTAQQGPTNPPGTDADIDLPEAWNLERGKPEVIIAVMDGGFDTSHPDLKPNLWISSDGTRFGINWNDPAQKLQPNNHATHVAGIMAAVNNNNIGVSGIAGGDGTAASGARLMNMQIFTSSGVYAGDDAVANAFVYAADHGACIAQNSWGGGQASTLVSDAIDYFIMNGGGAVLNGGLVVFSAGNSNSAAEVFPCNYPPVICVAATDYNDKKASYSNFNSKVDISAPGGDGSVAGFKQVLSTISNKSYGWLSGTSMAAPHVSGVAALCVSKSKNIMTADQLRSLLQATADDISALNPSYAGMLGSGRVNAYNAVQQSATLTAPTVNAPKSFTASQSCGQLTLTWTKNDQGSGVIIAQNDSLIFGIPSGTLSIGNSLAGGGSIIYKGSGSSFTTNIPLNSRKYYRIWSYNATQYSFYKTTTALYSQDVFAPAITAITGCNVTISWSDNLSCPSDSVLIVAGKSANLSTPSGIVAVGSILPTGEKVIYKGKAASFNYTLDADSTITIGKWNFNALHNYVQAPAGGTTSATVANAIDSLQATATGSTQVNISWRKSSSNCFGGTAYLLAYNTINVFGEPAGAYTAGDAISGGGTVMYAGSNTSFLQKNLTPFTDYYYKIWAIKTGNIYSFGKTTTVKTPCAIGSLSLPFADGFEGNDQSLPAPCTWTLENSTGYYDALQIVTSGDNPTSSPVQGNTMLRFNSYNIPAGETARLVSAPITKGAGTSMDIRFRWLQDSTDYVDAAYASEGVTVQWSRDKSNWQNLESYPRVPVEGNVGWSYKQLSLPDSSLGMDTVYVALLFTSAYGYNCYLDDFSLLAGRYKPADNTTATAVCEFTDSTSLWTHFYDSSGNRLLSLQKNGNDIGKAGQDSYMLQLGATGAGKIAASNNYVSNPGGWATMYRYFNIQPSTQPSSKVKIRFYYFDADITALASAANTLSPARTGISSKDLYGWRINGSYNANPASGQAGIPKASSFNTEGFAQYVNGPNPDTTTWQYTSMGNGLHRMEFTVQQLNGGGLGIGSTSGKGAFQIISYTFTGNGNWSNTANWLNGNKPPAILPNNGLIIINPVVNGECVLDVPQVVPAGASMQVNAGKVLLIKSDLKVQVP